MSYFRKMEQNLRYNSDFPNYTLILTPLSSNPAGFRTQKKLADDSEQLDTADERFRVLAKTFNDVLQADSKVELVDHTSAMALRKLPNGVP